MNKCQLSIITITYNNPDLKRTLDSVLSQSISAELIEHIIVDNLSTDGSNEIVKSYIDAAPYNVIYIREKDAGRYDAMNKGIKISNSEYLSFMNAGDKFYDRKSIATLIRNSKGNDIVYGNLNVVHQGKRNSIYAPPDHITFKYFLSELLPHQASVIRKKLFDIVGYYDDSYKIAADFKFFILAICKFKCKYLHINVPIATFYFDGISSQTDSAKLNNYEKDKVFNEHFSTVRSRKVKTVHKSINGGFKTPVLFMIFNRYDESQKVFNELKKIKPKYLYISADGARDHNPEEDEKCEKTRKIVDQIDWECDVKTLYRNTNFGCGNSVSKAITWFFQNVKQGIILEDDCVPDQSFFSYCESMLIKYQDDTRITHINGTALKQLKTTESYYFSKFCNVWGWATWKRSWDNYDFRMTSYPEFRRENRIADIYSDQNIVDHWLSLFEQVYSGKIDTWDYQWNYANMTSNGLTIMPHTNMITNIGFGEQATHTKNINDTMAFIRSSDIGSIIHPALVIPNYDLDRAIYESIGISTLNTKIKTRHNVVNSFNTTTEGLTVKEQKFIYMSRRLKHYIMPEGGLVKNLIDKLGE